MDKQESNREGNQQMSVVPEHKFIPFSQVDVIPTQVMPVGPGVCGNAGPGEAASDYEDHKRRSSS